MIWFARFNYLKIKINNVWKEILLSEWRVGCWGPEIESNKKWSVCFRFVPEWRTSCCSPIQFWKRLAMRRQTETTTRPASANTWTSISTSKATRSGVTSTTTCWRNRGLSSNSRERGTSTHSTRCARSPRQVLILHT